MSATTSRWAACVIALLLCGAPGCDARSSSGAASSAPRPVRSLVIIVPGTYGNDEHWPMRLADRETFATALARGHGGELNVHPYVWSSSIRGVRRLEAARMLSDDIDKLSVGYDRVILIGHSHGGNVALLAAGHCRARIDTVVCLATPHVYLRVVDGQKKKLSLPVYCSRKSRENIDQILCYRVDGDLVSTDWSNALLTGLSEAEALEMTRDYRAEAGSPRLANDGFFQRLLESDNLFASDRLALADHNQNLPCEIRDALGISQHHAIHSCDVGFALGQMLSGRGNVELTLAPIPHGSDAGIR